MGPFVLRCFSLRARAYINVCSPARACAPHHHRSTLELDSPKALEVLYLERGTSTALPTSLLACLSIAACSFCSCRFSAGPGFCCNTNQHLVCPEANRARCLLSLLLRPSYVSLLPRRPGTSCRRNSVRGSGARTTSSARSWAARHTCSTCPTSVRTYHLAPAQLR